MAKKEQDYYLSKLKKIMMFRYLKEDSLREVLKISDIINYKQDDKIISEGEVTPYLYAVLEGSVNVSVRREGEKEVFLCAIGVGEVFGEAGIFLTVKRTANVISTESTSILRIDRNELLAFIKRRPSSGIKVLMVIIYSLLRKLRESKQELAFERKSDIVQDDIDDLVDKLMQED